MNIISYISSVINSLISKCTYFLQLTSNKELVLPALILSCSSCIGISSLTLPGSVETTGVLLWPILLFFVAFLNYFSNQLLAKLAFMTKAKSYSQVCEHVMGDFRIIPDCLTLVSNLCLILSCNLTWVTFVDDLVFIIFSIRSTKLLLVLYMVLPNVLLVPTLLKNKVQDVAIPATISILAVVFLLLFVVSTFSAKLYNYMFSDTPDLMFSYNKIVLADFSAIPRSLCLLLFSFSYQQNIIDVSEDLNNQIYKKEDQEIMEEAPDSLSSDNPGDAQGDSEDPNTCNLGLRRSSTQSDLSVRSQQSTFTPHEEELKDRILSQMIHTILKMENFFKAFVFLFIGLFGFFSFCQKANLLDANILALYREQSSLVVYVNLFMAICVLVTAIFVFKPTKNTLVEIVGFIRSDISAENINKYCTYFLQALIILISTLLVIEKVSFIKLISIISFYVSPLIGIYLPVFLYAKHTGEMKYYVVSSGFLVVTLLTIWI